MMAIINGRLCLYLYALGVLICLIKLTTAQTNKWICYSTVCEEGIHFCNHGAQEKRCSRCEDFQERCFTKQQAPNCTAYCSDLKERQLKGRECGAAPDILNGTHNGSNIPSPQGTIITYTCNKGFTNGGLSEIECRIYGQWTVPPICEEITCQIKSPEHGRAVKGTLHSNKNVELVGGESVGYTHADSQLSKNEKIDVQYGEAAHFICDDGYILYGTSSVTCIQQGYLKVPMCIPVEPDCQCTVWKILFGGSLSLYGFMIVGMFVFCWFRKQPKSSKYGPIKEREDVVISMPTIPDKGANDSGIHTPLSAQSSAASMGTINKDETTPMKIDDTCTTRSRQGEEKTAQPAMNNSNTNKINITINTSGNPEVATKNDPPRPGRVTTFGIEESTGKKKEESPNTERKVVDRQVAPRPELDSNDIHHPLDDDSGEKAINHSQFENPSAAGPSSRPQTRHAQELNQDTKAKVMLHSYEVDRQDLGS